MILQFIFPVLHALRFLIFWKISSNYLIIKKCKQIIYECYNNNNNQIIIDVPISEEYLISKFTMTDFYKYFKASVHQLIYIYIYIHFCILIYRYTVYIADNININVIFFQCQEIKSTCNAKHQLIVTGYMEYTAMYTYSLYSLCIDISGVHDDVTQKCDRMLSNYFILLFSFSVS